MVKRWLLVISIIIGVLAVDQVTKQIVVDNMEMFETVTPVPALEGYFQFTRTFNTGSAFGFLPHAGDIFLVMAFVVVLAMLYYYPRIPAEGTITRIAIGLVAGGALGNAIDRIRYEHVVDFIHYRIPDLISNVSNLADHAIVLGVFLILVDSWRMERLAKRAEADAQIQEETSMDKLPYNE